MMERNLPEQCGRDVLAVFKSNRVAAGESLRFPLIRNGFVTTGRRFSDLSDGIYFLMQHGHLRRGRGIEDFEAYYLTDSGAQVIAGEISITADMPLQEQAAAAPDASAAVGQG